jgi:diphosphomevalonate decarboxylase
LLKITDTFSFDLLLKENQRFQAENPKFLERIEIYLPFLKDYHFTIDTQIRSHSSGIASSASGMALAMNFMSLEKLNPKMTNAYFYKSIFGRKCLPKCKGQVVVWETKPILRKL